MHATATFVVLLTFLTFVPHAFAQYYAPVERKPKIVRQPSGLTVEQGQTADLSAEADRDTSLYTYGKLIYQWMKDGARVTGATSTTLTITNAQPAASGAYTLIVSNKLGWVSTEAVTLKVFVPIPATIITQPRDTTVNEGTTAILSVVAQGTPAPTFRWRKNGNPISGATLSTLSLVNVQSHDAGIYDVLVSNSRNSVFSRAASLRITTVHPIEADAPLAILTQPTGAALNPGDGASLAVHASGDNPAYQWKKNGRPVSGATASALRLSSVTSADMGFYSVVVSSNDVSVESDRAIVTVASTDVSRIVNVSTRGFIPPGESLTPGFTLRGAGTAHVLVRAVGPTLGSFGVAGACVDPRLDLIAAGGSSALLTNDDWTASPAVDAASASVGAFGLEAGSKDAALLTSLTCASHQSYTARISAGRDDSGIALAEVYHAVAANTSVHLAAVSTLGFAAAGEKALVSGFTIQGAAPKRLLIRAVGPGLAQFGVRDLILDPHFAIFPAGETRAVASNDNWTGEASIAKAAEIAGAFALAPGTADAAAIVLLPPGGYTVAVTGVGGSTGTALVEIYDLDR
jgi:hypothetical protein